MISHFSGEICILHTLQRHESLHISAMHVVEFETFDKNLQEGHIVDTT